MRTCKNESEEEKESELQLQAKQKSFVQCLTKTLFISSRSNMM